MAGVAKGVVKIWDYSTEDSTFSKAREIIFEGGFPDCIEYDGSKGWIFIPDGDTNVLVFSIETC